MKGLDTKSMLIGAVIVIAFIKLAPRVPALSGIASKLS